MAPKRSGHDQNPPALLTIRQVADLDGTSEKTVRRAIAAGKLDIVRIGPTGRLIRVHPAAHAAYRWGHFGQKCP